MATIVEKGKEMKQLNKSGLWFFRLLFIVVFFLSGCAAQVPLMTAAADQAAKSDAVPVDKAALYVFREPTFCAQKALFSIAVDGLVVGWNANGTYYKLLLSPGSHELEAFGLVERLTGDITIFSPSKLALQLTAGNSYYVAQYSCFNDKLRQVGKDEGVKALTAMQLARFDTRNLSTNKVKEMVKSGSPVFKAPRTAPTTMGVRDDLSSNGLKATFSSILEGVGLALLIGLAVYGAAHSGGNTPSVPVYSSLLDRPAYEQRANTPPVRPSQTTYLSSSGDIYSVSGNTIFSPTKGEQWTINGDTIRGTNGSSYRMIGGTVYSETGQAYQLKNGSIIGSDGSFCLVTGSLINCK